MTHHASPAFHIREASPSEADRAAEIIRAAFEEEAVLDPPSGAIRETGDIVRGKMQQGGLVLAEIDGRAVGCVLYELREGHLYFGRLGVLPEHRGQGLGGALIAYVEARAQALGAPRIEIAVRTALPLTRARYERLGYGLIEERCHEGYTVPTYAVLGKNL